MFWGGAKLVQQKRQIVLFHTGEKWLMSPVKQICNKCESELGYCPMFNRIHHKKSVEKLLASSAVSIVPFNNDLRKDRTTKKICLT